MNFFNHKPKSSGKLSTNIAWAFQIVWRSGPGLTVANVILTFIQSLLPLINLYLIKLVIDGVSAGLTAPDRVAAFQGVTFLIIISGCVVLFERIVGTLGGKRDLSYSDRRFTALLPLERPDFSHRSGHAQPAHTFPFRKHNLHMESKKNAHREKSVLL